MISIAGRRAKADGAANWTEMTDGLPEPVDPDDRTDLLWHELTAHFRWYDRAATRCRFGYQGLRLVTLVMGATVTVLAAIGAPAGLTASLAAVIVVAEGVQQLFQFHANWIAYRSSAEALRQHAFLYAARAAQYAAPDRRGVLAEVLQGITSQEVGAWSVSMRKGEMPSDAGTPAS